MVTDLISNEPNLFRRIAIIDVSHGVEVTYKQRWYASRASWLVWGEFSHDDVMWCAPEYADDECMRDKDESDYLYSSIDRALLARLFSLKRIERKLSGVV